MMTFRVSSLHAQEILDSRGRPTLEVAVTLACGDDFFGEHEEDALEQLLRWLDEERPDVLVCGPSFDSGRYGYACGVLAREAARRGVPVVCGMYPESPACWPPRARRTSCRPRRR
jgi:glycine/betaine/sarcosine/D-proline reductase family selenoprotein B